MKDVLNKEPKGRWISRPNWKGKFFEVALIEKDEVVILCDRRPFSYAHTSGWLWWDRCKMIGKQKVDRSDERGNYSVSSELRRRLGRPCKKRPSLDKKAIRADWSYSFSNLP